MKTPKLDARLVVRHLPALSIPTALVVAILLSVNGVDARNSGALGLVQAMPLAYFALTGALCVSFVLHVRKEAPGIVLGAHMVGLIVVLHGVVAFIEQNPRFPTAYTHIGFIDYILRHNATLPALDARMSWPGFFAAGALLDRVAGAETFTFLLWAPLVINLAYAPLVWSIARSVSDDRRVSWLATAVFFLCSWVGQDYFAPQAVNFLIFLAFIAIMLRVFRTETERYPRLIQPVATLIERLARFVLRVPASAPAGSPLLEVKPQERALLVAALLVMYAATIVSHQLTPFFLLLDVAILALLRRTELRGFPLVLLIGVFTWISYGAVGFWSGHLNEIFGGAGEVTKTVSQNVGDRTAAVKSNHVMVIYGRLGLSAVLWFTALYGILRRFRAGRTDIGLIVLMFSPFLILGGQSYGGEAILRVFLFSLPFAATLAVLALLPAENRFTITKAVIASVIAIALVPAFMVTRYGNERFEYISPDELAAVEELYRIAPLGSSLAQFDPNSPWQIRTKNLYDFRGSADATADPEKIYTDLTKRKDTDAFLLLTRGQIEAVSFSEGLPRSWGDEMTERLVASGKFRLVYENRDARVFQAVKP